MAHPKGSGVRIRAEIKGIEKVEGPFKAVLFLAGRGRAEVLAEKKIKKDAFEMRLDMEPEQFPDGAVLAVVPESVKGAIQINRLTKSHLFPSLKISRELVLTREGILEKEDLSLRPFEKIPDLWKRTHKVCGRVVKRDPLTGSECPVPGAKVTVLDVDINFFWWHPFPTHPFCWIFPFWPRREELGSTITDECGRFCLDIPALDIDAMLKWRLRLRCLPELLRPVTILDAIAAGVRPDPSIFKELGRLPDLKPRLKPWPVPGPDPISEVRSQEGLSDPCPQQRGGFSKKMDGLEREKNPFDGVHLFEDSAFDMFFHELQAGSAPFQQADAKIQDVLERSAFPRPIPPPELPCNEELVEMLKDEKVVKAVKESSPIVRLFNCFVEMVPEWHLFFDVPDIVFKVEQDIDADGQLETIYDQGYFNINWNLSAPTTNVVIDAWENAICVPCGPSYQPCTTTGIVGINEMAVDPLYLSNTGYALRVNRPKPNGTRPSAETPFCYTLRLVGCPAYGKAAYYKVFYSHENRPETHFTESWYEYQISTHAPFKVAPDSKGFYKILKPEDDFFPYHTLLNWRTNRYPDGRYSVKLSLYDKNHKPLGHPLPPVPVVVDNSRPHPVDFTNLRWRKSGGSWVTLSLYCPIIHRQGQDIEIEMSYLVGASHLRDFTIFFRGCGGMIDSYNYWHHTVGDNLKAGTWKVAMPSSFHQGGYYFHIQARSRAFNAVGGLATNWVYDPVHIKSDRILTVVVLD